ncbi:hypothetical protein [Aquamicrobium sp.]|jgi:hypothetical protein|uniref:hypothetical protein n=1 Tax=Aquamicrobium sp. TaxID=1872579 RepID=UPI00258CD160|nr:hypothetical protein [Aquamicrobium sp.]MCK9550277.1 hypothetical protein [Aquamicrobium sp.]
MLNALFDPLGFNLFQTLVLFLFALAIGWVIGAAWAGDRREETDLHFAGRDLQDEARRGLIERRRQPRPPQGRQTNIASRSVAREPNREWMR